jgi:hypothetical protein
MRMFHSLRLVPPALLLGLLLGIVVAPPAHATAINVINFTNTTGVAAAPTGSFTYGLGPSCYYPGVPCFTNFTVLWDGMTFDLTSSANGPESLGFPLCTPLALGPVLGFQIMNQSVPVPSCVTTLTYSWSSQVGGDASTASFGFAVQSAVGGNQGGSLVIYADPTGTPTIANTSSSGDWTLAPVTTPEPATLLLAGAGLACLGVRRRKGIGFCPGNAKT